MYDILSNLVTCSSCFKDSADLASSGIILTSFMAQRAPVFLQVNGSNNHQSLTWRASHCDIPNTLTYLLVASYTQPNVPLPRSLPFCHWPATEGISTFGAGWLLKPVCIGVKAPGGSGNGWKLTAPFPSMREILLSGCNLECIGDGGALVFLGIRIGLLNALEWE